MVNKLWNNQEEYEQYLHNYIREWFKKSDKYEAWVDMAEDLIKKNRV